MATYHKITKKELKEIGDRLYYNLGAYIEHLVSQHAITFNILKSNSSVSLGAEAKKMHRSRYFHFNDGLLSQVNINMYSKEVTVWAGFPNLVRS